jgi:CDGSH-type Zn-finger protein/uncharacterized Fe-S cluster protein YjdI
MARTRDYESDGIRVRYDVDRCIHEEECIHGSPEVFDRYRRPWVDPSLAPPDEVARVVEGCPTGALEYERRDGGSQEQPPGGNRLTIGPNGPLYGHGDIELRDSEARFVSREVRVALCRCGASSHKPYCDGQHADSGFSDPGSISAPMAQPVTDKTPAGLTVRLSKDGPLLLAGRFELRGSDGSELEAGGGALCRCGASSAKPFCDGTHKTIGFEAADPEGES